MTSDKIIMSPAQLLKLFPDLRDYKDEMETAEHVEARIIAKGKEFIDIEAGERKISALIMPYFVFENGKARTPEISSFSVEEQVWIYANRWGFHHLTGNVKFR